MKFLIWFVIALACNSCVDPGYHVGDATLKGNQLSIDVQYGIGTQMTVGILLVEGLQATPANDEWHDRYSDVTLDRQAFIHGGSSYPIVYSETNPAWVKPSPNGSIARQEFTRHVTQTLPAAVISKIKTGKITAVMITDGDNPGELLYWPCVIR